MVLIVLRHGESEWNKLNIFTGWKNPSLSQAGIKEAESTGKLLSEYTFDFVYTSDLIRTIETAEIILNKNYFTENCCIHYAEEFKERDYGELTGLNKSELEQIHGSEQVNNWRRGWESTPPSGESLKDVAKRVGIFFDIEIKPLLKSNSNILIVAHGNSLRALFVHLGIKTCSSIEKFEIDTGIPIMIDIQDKKFEYINRYKLIGSQIIDSRGFPTIQVECLDLITQKIIGKGSTPSGASCGSNEVLELRDGNKDMFMGKSIYSSIDKLELVNRQMCISKITNLINIDSQLLLIDPTQNKNIIGGNTSTAISFCFADVGASKLDLEMFEYFNKIYRPAYSINSANLPIPMVNIINGGKHGVTDDLKIQEFMIMCNKNFSTNKQIQIICEVYHSLKNLLIKKYGKMAKSIGDEGGFCPPIYSAEEALETISESIKLAGYLPGSEVYACLDCASSEFYNHETKLYEVEKNLFLTNIQLVEYYEKLINKFPYLTSIEDGFDESDYEGWKLFTEKLGSKIMIVGDDLFTTNPKIIKSGLDLGLANALLLKVNQIGTITESVQAANLMFDKNLNVIVSHRSGETNHAYIVDLAVGIGAQYLKIGSPCRGERVAKFNRLLEIFNYLERLK